MKNSLKIYPLFSLAALTSFCGMSYEQLVVKVLSTLCPQVVLLQTMTLGFFLATVGLGCFFCEKIKDQKLPTLLLRIELSLSFVGALSIPLIYAIYFVFKFFIHDIVSDPFESAEKTRIVFTLACQIITSAVGFLSGLELIAFVRLADQTNSPKKSSLVITANYLGTLAATLLSSFLLFPMLSPLHIASLISIFNLMIYFWLSSMLENFSGAVRVLVSFFVIGVITASIANKDQIEQWHLKARYSRGIHLTSWKTVWDFTSKILLRSPDILRISTPYQTADFVHLEGSTFSFFLDGHPQIEPSWIESYHESLVHIPVQFFRQTPSHVLILGGGDGIATSEILKYDKTIEKIDLVEIDPTILNLARNSQYFLKLNHAALNHPKVHLFVTDAIRFLRTSKEIYDVIYIDFPLPFDNDLLKLFSIEFYRMVKAHLAKEGFIALDSGLRCLREDDPQYAKRKPWNEILVSTLYYAGFHQIEPYISSEIFLTARREKKQVNRTFLDYGIALKKLNPALLTHSSDVTLGVKPNRKSINSLFKPKLYSLKDPDF